jgi:hypothetical protein
MFTLSFVACDDDDNKGEEPPVPVTFEVAVSDVETTSATVAVTPSDANATYYFDVVKKATFDELGSPTAVAEKVIADLKKYQAENGAVLSDTLSQGNDSRVYTEVLSASTEYTACAFGVDASGKLTTEVFTQDFTTKELPPLVIEGLANCSADYWGNKLGTVNGKWILTLTSANWDKYMNLEVATALEQKDNPVGVYEISDPYGEVGTASPGYQDGDNFEGCTYIEYVTFPAEGVFMVSGTITITSTGEGVYKVEIDARDGDGRRIQAVYEGDMHITDKTYDYGYE